MKEVEIEFNGEVVKVPESDVEFFVKEKGAKIKGESAKPAGRKKAAAKEESEEK